MSRWSVFCMDEKHPGLWRSWLQERAVAVGWFSGWGYLLEGGLTTRPGWNYSRANLKKVKVGHLVVAHLRHKRVGRIGEVIGLKFSDEDWNPLVPECLEEPEGEQGRRILVRWLPEGPTDPGMVVQLPKAVRLPGQNAVEALYSEDFDAIRKAVQDPTNWIPFATELVVSAEEVPVEQQLTETGFQFRD